MTRITPARYEVAMKDKREGLRVAFSVVTMGWLDTVFEGNR